MTEWLQSRSSYLWLTVSGLCIVLIAIVSLRPNDTPGTLSPRNANGDGGLALILWLDKLGYHTRDLTSSFSVSDLPPSQSTLFVLPGGDLDTSTTSDVLSWVRRSGGRVVLVTDGSNGSALLNALGLRLIETPDEVVRVSEPVLLSPSVSTLDGDTTHTLAALPLGSEAAETGAGPVLARRVLGRGDAWILAAPDLLDNAHITHTHNSALALNLAGPRGSAVIFDEYLQTSPSDNAYWLTGSVWGALMWFLFAVLLLHRWLAGRRLGPAVIPLAEGHRAATEYVVSIARLLRRGRKRNEILATYQRELRRTVRERFGENDVIALSPERRTRVETLLSAPGPHTDAELLRLTSEIVQCEDEVRTGRI